MSSTLTLLATTTAWREPAVDSPALAAADALLLPAATSAPDALVIAVESWLSQETSALVQGGAAGSKAGSDLGSGSDVLGVIAGRDVVVGDMSDEAAVLRASTAAFAAPAVVRTHVQGPPSRGTPV